MPQCLLWHFVVANLILYQIVSCWVLLAVSCRVVSCHTAYTCRMVPLLNKPFQIGSTVFNPVVIVFFFRRSSPFAFSGRQCKISKDPNGCTNRVPPFQSCSGTCVSKDVICNRTNTCGYPEIQIKSNCGGKEGLCVLKIRAGSKSVFLSVGMYKKGYSP